MTETKHVRRLSRRWFVGFVVEPALAPASMRREAERWRDRSFRNANMWACWTFRGATRLAHRRNFLRSAVAQPGTWEVFGPLGKDGG
jgi:hypothetical protein